MDKLIGNISKLLESIQSGLEQDGAADTEIPEFQSQQELAAFFQDKYQKFERTLHKKNRQVRELATELAVSSFFPNDGAKRKAKAEANGINVSFSGYSVVFVRIVDSSNLFYGDASDALDRNNDDAIKTIICSIFGELLGEHFNSDYAFIEEGYAFLVGSNLRQDEFMANLTRIAKEAVDLVEGGFAMRLLACVGPYCHDFETINDCFRTALDLREYSMSISEPPSILVSEDGEVLPASKPNEDEFMSVVVDHQYMNAIISYDFQSALEMTKSLVQSRYGETPNKRRGLKPFLSARLATTAELLSCSFKGIIVNDMVAQTEIDRMLQHSDIDEILKSLTTIFGMLDSFYNHSSHEHVGTVGNVIAYVTENYAVSSLSVGSICEALGKSRSYLSRIFKENTDMNLLDFLHTTRINEAKRLLIETDLSITEIGERVGYYSGWTLARVFKRYEGITPSVYRNRIWHLGNSQQGDSDESE